MTVNQVLEKVSRGKKAVMTVAINIICSIITGVFASYMAIMLTLQEVSIKMENVELRLSQVINQNKEVRNQVENSMRELAARGQWMQHMDSFRAETKAELREIKDELRHYPTPTR